MVQMSKGTKQKSNSKMAFCIPPSPQPEKSLSQDNYRYQHIGIPSGDSPA